MIDFQSKALFKLKPEDIKNGFQNVKELLIEGEVVIDSYVSIKSRKEYTHLL